MIDAEDAFFEVKDGGCIVVMQKTLRISPKHVGDGSGI